jgi:hypothetical protein
MEEYNTISALRPLHLHANRLAGGYAAVYLRGRVESTIISEVKGNGYGK